MALFSKRMTTTRGRLVAIVALLAVVAYAPSAFGAKQSTLDLARSALAVAKGADRKATTALRPVGSKRIKDGTVRAVDLADNAVGTSHIQNGSIGTGDIGDGSVTGTDVTDGSIVAADVAASAITSAKIQDGEVTLADLASAQGTAVIDPDSLLAGECALQSFVAPSLVNGDRVVINFQTSPDDALEVTAMVATGPDLRLRICNRSAGTIDAAAFAASYFSLR